MYEKEAFSSEQENFPISFGAVLINCFYNLFSVLFKDLKQLQI